jgi:hypothetical protein
VPGVEQLRGVRAVDLPALALAVRPLGAADVRALVPVQAEPAQRGENRGLALARAAHRVRVLDAQDELAAVLPGKAQVEERDVGRADVGVARGRGRDACANRHEGSQGIFNARELQSR